MLRRIVWAAVASVMFAVASITFAVFGQTDLTIALGAASITTAVLATRER